MKKIVIAPDSFKGTLSSEEVCETVKNELLRRYPDADITAIPVADGGEGTVNAFLYALGGERVYCKVSSPLGRQIDAFYAILPDNTAVIEMAQASGITLEKEKNATDSSSFGTGEMLLHALSKGMRNIIIGIGGSATTDGGIGMLTSLGIKFLDKNNVAVPPCGRGLQLIEKIDLSCLDERIKECDITVLCDVKNPLYGKNGAAYIFSPQKGADENDVIFLDKGLRNLANVSKNVLGKDYSSLEGAGAAGGLGFGLVAFLGAKLQRGVDCVLDTAGFDTKAEEADLIITGEGRMDEQSLMGKVPFSIAERSAGKRVIAIVGLCDIDKVTAARHGIAQITETNPLHLPFEEIKHCAKQMLIDACGQIII